MPRKKPASATPENPPETVVLVVCDEFHEFRAYIQRRATQLQAQSIDISDHDARIRDTRYIWGHSLHQYQGLDHDTHVVQVGLGLRSHRPHNRVLRDRFSSFEHDPT